MQRACAERENAVTLKGWLGIVVNGYCVFALPRHLPQSTDGSRWWEKERHSSSSPGLKVISELGAAFTPVVCTKLPPQQGPACAPPGSGRSTHVVSLDPITGVGSRLRRNLRFTDSGSRQIDVVPVATGWQLGTHKLQDDAGFLEEVCSTRDLDTPRMS